MRVFSVFTISVLFVACRSSDSPSAPLEGLVAQDASVADQQAPSTPDGGLVEDSGTKPLVGAAGGTVESADGQARITVPPGALASDSAIAITPTSVAPPASASKAFEFGPDGLTFAKDASICLEVDPAADVSKACLGYLAPGDRWVCEDSCLKKEGTTLCGSTQHFTNFAILLSGGRGPDTTCDDAVFDTKGGSLSSPDGAVTLTAPAGALKGPLRITVASEPIVDDNIGSAVFDFSPDGTKFAAKVGLCITPKQGADTKSACLGYLNPDKKWVCEDPCLERKDDSLCGTTDHFTNFAILLTGGKGTSCTN